MVMLGTGSSGYIRWKAPRKKAKVEFKLNSLCVPVEGAKSAPVVLSTIGSVLQNK